MVLRLFSYVGSRLFFDPPWISFPLSHVYYKDDIVTMYMYESETDLF